MCGGVVWCVVVSGCQWLSLVVCGKDVWFVVFAMCGLLLQWLHPETDAVLRSFMVSSKVRFGLFNVFVRGIDTVVLLFAGHLGTARAI